MIRILSLFMIVTLMSFVPAMAQEDADAVLSETTEQSEDQPIKDLGATEEEYEQRLALSRKMHEIWPVRPKIESALDNISLKIPQQERLKFKAAMRKAIKFEAVEEASIDAMADIFTIKELEAMIEFYGSKEGRSVSYKTSDYEAALQPTLVKMIDKALLDVKLGSE